MSLESHTSEDKQRSPLLPSMHAEMLRERPCESKFKTKEKGKGKKRIGTPVEFCQQSRVLSTISFKRAICRLAQEAGTVEWRGWLFFKLETRRLLGSYLLKKDTRTQTLPFPVGVQSVARANQSGQTST